MTVIYMIFVNKNGSITFRKGNLNLGYIMRIKGWIFKPEGLL